jgi:hypothetical protein
MREKKEVEEIIKSNLHLKEVYRVVRKSFNRSWH